MIRYFFHKKRDFLHHLLVHVKLETNVTIIERIKNTSELDMNNFKVVWHKEVTGLLHVLSVVGLT